VVVNVLLVIRVLIIVTVQNKKMILCIMDIIITEIIEEENINEFNNIKNEITHSLNRFSDEKSNTETSVKKSNTETSVKKSNTETSVKINTNTQINIDLVKIIYDKLFKKPIDNMYDINRLKVIEKHLKQNNLI